MFSTGSRVALVHASKELDKLYATTAAGKIAILFVVCCKSYSVTLDKD